MRDGANTRINLLPWRENSLTFENRKFGFLSGVVFLMGIGISFGITTGVGVYNENVSTNIAYLDSEINSLKVKISKIRSLRNQKAAILRKIGVIHNLQRDRINIVALFNNLAESVPPQISLSKIVRVNDNIEINGQSNSHSGVSKLMRNLEKHNILTNTDLNKIQLSKDGELKFILETSWKKIR